MEFCCFVHELLKFFHVGVVWDKWCSYFIAWFFLILVLTFRNYKENNKNYAYSQGKTAVNEAENKRNISFINSEFTSQHNSLRGKEQVFQDVGETLNLCQFGWKTSLYDMPYLQ